jgi:hypothetical protein
MTGVPADRLYASSPPVRPASRLFHALGFEQLSGCLAEAIGGSAD